MDNKTVLKIKEKGGLTKTILNPKWIIIEDNDGCHPLMEKIENIESIEIIKPEVNANDNESLLNRMKTYRGD